MKFTIKRPPSEEAEIEVGFSLRQNGQTVVVACEVAGHARNLFSFSPGQRTYRHANTEKCPGLLLDESGRVLITDA